MTVQETHFPALHVSVSRGERTISPGSLLAVTQESIDAFHGGRPAAGAAACAALLNEPALPAHLRELSLQNQTFYAHPLIELVPQLRLQEVTNPAPGTRLLAVSPCVFGERLVALASLAIPADPFQAHHQMVAMNQDLRIVTMVPLAQPGQHAVQLSQLFPAPGQSGLLVTALAQGTQGPDAKRVMVAEIVAGTMHNARFSAPLVGEEAYGWAPIATPFGPRFVASWEPTDIVQEDRNATGFVRTSRQLAPLLASHFSPGSPGIPVSGGYLLLVNERIRMPNGEEVPLARFVQLNAAWQIMATSPQWYLTGRGNDIMTGLTLMGSDLLLAATSQSAGALLGVLPLAAVVALLQVASIPGGSS